MSKKRAGLFILLACVAVVAMIVVMAVGGCGDEEDENGTTETIRESAPAPAGGGDDGADGGMDDGDGDGDDGAVDGDGDGDVDGDGDGDGDGPEVVRRTEEAGPCVDGMREVTTIVEYADGTGAGSTSMEPCEE